jgi:hypothetical protein
MYISYIPYNYQYLCNTRVCFSKNTAVGKRPNIDGQIVSLVRLFRRLELKRAVGKPRDLWVLRVLVKPRDF